MSIFRQKKLLLGFVGLMTLALVVGVGLFIFLGKNESSPVVKIGDSNNSTETAATQEISSGFPDALPDCNSNPHPEFTHEVTDLSKIQSLTPPVTIQGNDLKTHGYLHTFFDQNEKVPVYAPIDARVYEGAFYDVAGSGPLYTFFFEVSCEVRFMIDHIAEPVEKLIKEMPSSPADSSQGIRFKPIEFKAGELIGYVGFTEGSQNWDLGVYNSEEENPYRDEKYEQSNTFRYSNAVCPYVYFSNELKTKYKKLFSDSYGNQIESDTNLCADI